jgi:all-trans-8'-apo-beta-carotenal 15,15'-oxygenase
MCRRCRSPCAAGCRAGLGGAFFRNGPARHELGGQRYQHWFDGDGMVQKYSLGEGGIVHQGRFLRTPKFVADSAAGRPVRVAFGTQPPGAPPPGSADSINVANTSLVAHAGELLALWEGGSATPVDTTTLAGGEPKAWSPDYAGMPFSAHPRREVDGTLWNFGVSSAQGLLSIYRISAAGLLLKAVTMPVPNIAMVHDFAVTERHLVFLLPSLVFDRSRLQAGATFLDSHVWKPELGMRVLLLPKDRLDAPRWFELPAGFVFHLGNACEEGGVIRLDHMRTADAWQATVGFKRLMAGRHDPHDFATTALVELDLASGQARQTILSQANEFPRVDPRFVGRPYRQVFSAARIDAGERPGYDAVMRLDVVSGRSEHYRYGAEIMVEEHLFVPRPGSSREGEGWLVGTALDLKRSQMLFSVFDAQRLADGPLMQATLDRPMPLGLHGVFIPA